MRTWTEDEFYSVIDLSLSRSGDIILAEITAPPGTRKTLSTVRYFVSKRKPVVMAFPTHTNQTTALKYIADTMERSKPRKLPLFVLDYGGIDNYCILNNPEMLMSMLDRYGEDSYEKAVLKFLYEPTISSIILRKNINIETVWIQIGRLLDKYKVDHDIKAYKKGISEIIERVGREDTCKNVCPIGLFFWNNRAKIYRMFADPKIITFRKEDYDIISKKYKYVGRHVVLADPSRFIENIDDILAGKGLPQCFLCPRLLLVAKSSITRSKRANFITVRNSIVLTPHAGLDFITSVIGRVHNIQNIPIRHSLFLDEYDARMKPVKFPVYPLVVLDELMKVSDMVLSKRVGDKIDDIVIDENIINYAKYVKNTARKIKEIVTNSLKTGVYHPLVNFFIEGALSSFKEEILNYKGKLGVLSPRYIHIKHFIGDNTLSLILNNGEIFGLKDKVFRAQTRIAILNFNKLAIREIPNKKPYISSQEVKFKTVRERINVNILPTLRKVLSILLTTPRFVVFYSYGDRIYMESIDHRIYQLFSLRRAVLTSASPLLWNLFVSGPVESLSSNPLERVSTGSLISSIFISTPETIEYIDKREKIYTAIYLSYREEDKARIIEAVERGDNIPPITKFKTEKKKIIQIHPHTTKIKEYSELLDTVYLPSLTPLYIPFPAYSKDDIQEVRERIRESIKPYIQVMISLKKKKEPILIITQNKLYANILAKLTNAKRCRQERCGDDIKKITHYQSGNISITWFRSRAGRGIDLPYNYRYVLVVGSPLPRPSFTIEGSVPTSHLTTLIAQFNQYYIKEYRTRKRKLITITHIPLDVLHGMSELTQAIGRATRSALRGGKVKILFPAFLRTRVVMYTPEWIQ